MLRVATATFSRRSHAVRMGFIQQVLYYVNNDDASAGRFLRYSDGEQQVYADWMTRKARLISDLVVAFHGPAIWDYLLAVNSVPDSLMCCL